MTFGNAEDSKNSPANKWRSS